jgi:hypothetical protein
MQVLIKVFKIDMLVEIVIIKLVGNFYEKTTTTANLFTPLF